MATSDTITLGVQMGGTSANDATDSHVLSLRKLLATLCKGPYSSEVDEFALILRVDGDIWHWDFEGCQKLRRSKKDRYITIDIGVPRSRWENVAPAGIRGFLAENVEHALLLCANRLIKDKSDMNIEALMADYQKVKAAYLHPK